MPALFTQKKKWYDAVLVCDFTEHVGNLEAEEAQHVTQQCQCLESCIKHSFIHQL